MTSGHLIFRSSKSPSTTSYIWLAGGQADWGAGEWSVRKQVLRQCVHALRRVWKMKDALNNKDRKKNLADLGVDTITDLQESITKKYLSFAWARQLPDVDGKKHIQHHKGTYGGTPSGEDLGKPGHLEWMCNAVCQAVDGSRGGGFESTVCVAYSHTPWNCYIKAGYQGRNWNPHVHAPDEEGQGVKSGVRSGVLIDRACRSGGQQKDPDVCKGYHPRMNNKEEEGGLTYGSAVYNVGKHCEYSFDYLNGKFAGGDLCIVELKPNAYRKDKTPDDSIRRMQAVDDNSMLHAVVKKAAGRCYTAYQKAFAFRQALRGNSKQLKRVESSVTGVASESDLFEYVRRHFSGNGWIRLKDSGNPDDRSWEQRQLRDIQGSYGNNWSWMCHLICDFLKADPTDESQLCIAYTYTHDTGECVPKSRVALAKDPEYDPKFQSSLCVSRSCDMDLPAPKNKRPVVKHIKEDDPGNCGNKYPSLFKTKQDCKLTGEDDSDVEWEEPPSEHACPSCGIGVTGKRRKKVLQPRIGKGRKCNNTLVEFDCKKEYDTKPCDCELSEGDNWDEESDDEGDGVVKCHKCGDPGEKGKRQRVVKTKAQKGGKCKRDLHEYDCADLGMKKCKCELTAGYEDDDFYIVQDCAKCWRDTDEKHGKRKRKVVKKPERGEGECYNPLESFPCHNPKCHDGFKIRWTVVLLLGLLAILGIGLCFWCAFSGGHNSHAKGSGVSIPSLDSEPRKKKKKNQSHKKSTRDSQESMGSNTSEQSDSQTD
mmetsp:Transcript_4664/g.11423  ORF Transcript_4664/g.11423 Transcript_4664/m.11423 type:complete len:761 (+) Transcript_4664:877-3159(+)